MSNPTATAPVLPAATNASLIESLRKPVSRIFGLAWLAAALLAKPDGFNHGWYIPVQLVGFFLLIAAAMGRLWAYAYIGGRKNAELCREGPYALTRNPLYVFSFVGVIGACLALEIPSLCVISVVFYLGYYALVIRAEEKRLSALFGSAFTDYCAKVPRFWPKFGRPKMDDRNLALPSRLFMRTMMEVFWFLAAIVFIEGIEAAKEAGWWYLVPTPF
ncbi:MAG TPA: isoprenylcysteine carboxylmethyltransferase family protein [Candidatus Didemnitutus sp.]|nr:isoprenylcysteine carboxylmethyltransferase family protein [Candidatus Didemnitutus sp.]